MPNNKNLDADNGQPEPSSAEDRTLVGLSREEEIRRMSERIRTVQLESEARIKAMWKKRGLFGFTTSTG